MMIRKFLCSLLPLIAISMPQPATAELIVLASPLSGDPYYKDMVNTIFEFHIAYAKKIAEHDDVLILTDKANYAKYVKELGGNRVLVAPMLDIWMRDFATANSTSPVMFRYTAVAQSGSQRDADAVQEELALLAEKAGLSFAETDLLNDGGNYVDDYAGSVVISKKFLSDNRLSEREGRARIMALTGAKHVAFIEADEQGGLEHADGVVCFVDTNTLVINSYPEDQDYVQELKRDLKRGLPGVKIHEIITPYDSSDIFDEKFGSARGLYTNALVTPERIYLPQFGIPEDAIAFQQVQAATSRQVIPVPSDKVSTMGGGVRCMSWQLRGENAERLLRYVGTMKDH